MAIAYLGILGDEYKRRYGWENATRVTLANSFSSVPHAISVILVELSTSEFRHFLSSKLPYERMQWKVWNHYNRCAVTIQNQQFCIDVTRSTDIFLYIPFWYESRLFNIRMYPLI